MSTPQNRFTTTPVRQDAVCMCAHAEPCSSFAPGHALHLIQARLVASTPTEWVDAIVHAVDDVDGALILRTLDGRVLQLWSAGAATTTTPGTPVAVHERYHALSAGGRLYNAAVV
ncbi:hypothetical protein [Microbacterium dextranolyticum]|uniref:Uncharacterized protein n=1 Tax=Microbacterium dextranolyticum TaxID=36806 RepID=A0A9W6HNI5_9MICO|nr:hypothetical protein [Microbacterium dextranolyticum]MBM7462619.1 hypothetical protein [Microbacterium dextranolyticum]GLJ96278.1 hypothetical protein GCM10017591_23410 [Microbacterium dextranolyticum]